MLSSEFSEFLMEDHKNKLGDIESKVIDERPVK